MSFGFFVEKEREATIKIFWTEKENKADLKVFFCEKENKAKWRNEKHELIDKLCEK
jgi:hypothetical protein